MFYFSLLQVGYSCPLAVLLLEVAVHAGDHLGVVVDAVHTGAGGQLVDGVADVLQNQTDITLEDDLHCSPDGRPGLDCRTRPPSSSPSRQSPRDTAGGAGGAGGGDWRGRWRGRWRWRWVSCSALSTQVAQHGSSFLSFHDYKLITLPVFLHPELCCAVCFWNISSSVKPSIEANLK